MPVFLTLGAAPGHETSGGLSGRARERRRFQARYPDLKVSLTHGFPWRVPRGAGSAPDWLWEPFEDPRLHLEVSFPVRLGDVFEYPYREVWPHAWRRCCVTSAPDRLLWGSDMPFQDRFCTYRQSHEWLDRSGLLDPGELAAIKGGTAARLLGLP